MKEKEKNAVPQFFAAATFRATQPCSCTWTHPRDFRKKRTAVLFSWTESSHDRLISASALKAARRLDKSKQYVHFFIQIQTNDRD